MDLKVTVFFIVVIFMYLAFIIHLLKKKKLELKYTLSWLISSFVLLIIIVFPSIMYWISNIIGIKTPINSALILGCMFIILILITITSIVSSLNKNLRMLIQEVALLEKRVRELEKNKCEEENE